MSAMAGSEQPPHGQPKKDQDASIVQVPGFNERTRYRMLLWPVAGCVMALAMLVIDQFFDLQVTTIFGIVTVAVIIVGALVVQQQFRDIDIRRRALALAKNQADEASRAKSQFLAVMSHELRTPMTGMIGTLDLLRETPLSPTQRQLTETLASSSAALLTVLNDILDFSKIEAGMLSIEAIDFHLDEVIASTLSLFRAQAAKKGLVIAVEMSRDVPQVLRGDPTRLRQVLTNLMGNALKFTDVGHIDLRVVRLSESPLVLRFEVQDTGVGISHEKQGALFQPFVQGDVHTSRRFGGTGLGLAICSRLVGAMGGRIGLTSAIGLGSCFWFTIKLEEGNKDSAVQVTNEPPPPMATKVTTARLLVAEDNEVNRFLIEEHLRRRGYSITLVENGWAAVEAHLAHPFDVILMDMRMPVMDGPTATKRIRALPPPACSVPIIALTADAMREDAQRYLRSGIDALHTKPIDWDSLEGTLHRFLEDGGGRPKAPVVPARTAPTIDPHLDTNTLVRLREVMGEAGMADLIAAFRTTLANEGAKLHAATDDGGAREVREAAHAIQGMAAEMGAHGIVEVVRAIRLDGDGALDARAAQQKLDEYDNVVDATLRRLESYSENRAAS